MIEPSGCFCRHPCVGREPWHSANRFLDNAKASLRVLPPLLRGGRHAGMTIVGTFQSDK